MTSHVEQAIAARIARVRAEQEAKQRMREEFAAARAAGVAQRHARKLYRQTAHSTEETPVPAALSAIHCPACRQERLARLMTTVLVGGASYDLLRCAAQECELLWCVRANRPRTAPAAAA
jgi:excinuclease UvrABC ATPase subunit